MANILQAAKWMQEGKRVRRSGWPIRLIGKMSRSPKAQSVFSFCAIRGIMTSSRIMRVDDLLAEDWEIAEATPPEASNE